MSEIELLHAKYLEVVNRFSDLSFKYADMVDSNLKLNKKCEVLSEALAFYADPDTWRPVSNSFASAIETDRDGDAYVPGNFARKALAEAEAIK